MNRPCRAFWMLTRKAHSRRLLAWSLTQTALVLAITSAMRSLHSDGADRLHYVLIIGSSCIQELFNGCGYDLTFASGIEAFRVGMFGFVLVPAGASLFTVCFIQAEETFGRWEVVSVGGYGKTAPTTAVMAARACSTVLSGATSSAGLPLSGSPAGSAVRYCLILHLFVLVFVAAVALLAQTAMDAKAAGIAVMAWVMSCYLVRVAVDGRRLSATWFTPTGWLVKARLWRASYLWPYAVCVTTVAALATAAFVLCRVRGLGGTMVSSKLGRASVAKQAHGAHYI